MPVIRCYVPDDIMQLLQDASNELGREVDQLAESAIENAALEFKRSRSVVSQDREAI